MNNWTQALIRPTATLRDALEAINSVGSQMVLVVDDADRLLGTLTDGDARRALLRGVTLDDPATTAMYTSPTVASTDDDEYSILASMRRKGLHQMPILGADRRVVGLRTVDDFLSVPTRDNWVVIMAGGEGRRLQELTRHVPKPMLKVGSRPILETVIRNFADQGFDRFFLAVNYKAEQIEAHFGDGRAFGVRIDYLREREPLGTAGSLCLLPEHPKAPFVVTNADLLTKEHFGRMVDGHVASGADATMAVRDYEIQVPFGVVRQNNGTIEAIDEKPIQQFVVSAGMYVLAPQVLEYVPPGRYFDMPSLFEELVRRGLRARCHNVNGYWLDIGRMADFERANIDFGELFK